MKLNRMGWMAALTLAGFLAADLNSLAQEKKDRGDQKPPAGQGQRRPGQPDRLATMKETLKLTDEQIQKLKPIFKEEADKLKALREDTSVSQEDKRTKAREAREAFVPKIKAVLTKEQAELWEKSRQEQRRGGGQPGQPGQRRQRGQGNQQQ
jgi:Spy/CpxP family protein refolding chaperone